VAGLWLAQESRATWRREGREWSWDELTAEANAAERFRSLIDPDAALFIAPGDMPARIRDFCRRAGQPVPETVGQVIRAIYESLALKYRVAVEQLIALSGRSMTFA
jgi:rhamnulokinase/L-fuculokinase